MRHISKPPAVTLLDAAVSGVSGPWVRAASLLHIRGTGALRWQSDRSGPGEDGRTASCLRLRETPLAFCQSAGCPTCESLLAAGWGRDTADWPELETVRDTLNGGCAGLADAARALAPVLELLPTGLYVLGDVDCYPTDGSGRFFEDVPDGYAPYPATACQELMDDDFAFAWPDPPPVYLYPTQPRSALDEGRVAWYMARLQETGPAPRALALSLGAGMSVLLDGHHKAAAAARLGRCVPTLVLFPQWGWTYRKISVTGKLEEQAAVFGTTFTAPVQDIPRGLRPDRDSLYRTEKAPMPGPGRLADREVPEVYRAAAGRYPTAYETALVAEAGSCFSDGELEEWLADIGHHRARLRAALVLLRQANAPRLKAVALACGRIPEKYCALREEAFSLLAGMRGDRDVEDFFIDYFINAGEDSASDALTAIAHRFWD